MKKIVLLLGIFLMVAILLACAPKIVPAKETALSETQRQLPKDKAKEAWETEWEKTLSGAKREGHLMLYTGIGPEPRNAITRGFKNKFGFEIEIVSGRGEEMAEKVIREYKAGINAADLYLSGNTTIILQMKPAGVLDSLEPYLILPEITDPKVWWQGRLPYVDKDKLVFAFSAFTTDDLTVNTDTVKTEELKSYKDLLDPKWKGKIVMNDPTSAGRGLQWFGVFGEMIGFDYMRELVKQSPAITRDLRQQVEWIARGRYPVGIGATTQLVLEFQAAGVPLKGLTLQEGGYISSGFGSIVLLKKAPHPNMAAVFLNWLLSREGQEIISVVMGYQSAREDVSTEHLKEGIGNKPRQSGVKYFNAITEEHLLNQAKHMKMAQDIFAPLLK